MNITTVDINQIKLNTKNPRIIKDEKFNKLVKSIQNFPKMLEIRPIVVDDNMIVLGGNMRLKACKEAGMKEIPIIKASDLTEEQKKEFIIKDNQSFGEWDNNMLGEFGKDLLLDSGFDEYQMIDIFGINEMESTYSKAIEGSNFNEEVVDVNQFIKQNILFFNEMMLEFEDDKVKESIRKIKDKEAFTEEIKKVILKYGQ